jgi:hypothetical protein
MALRAWRTSGETLRTYPLVTTLTPGIKCFEWLLSSILQDLSIQLLSIKYFCANAADERGGRRLDYTNAQYDAACQAYQKLMLGRQQNG